MECIVWIIVIHQCKVVFIISDSVSILVSFQDLNIGSCFQPRCCGGTDWEFDTTACVEPFCFWFITECGKHTAHIIPYISMCDYRRRSGTICLFSYDSCIIRQGDQLIAVFHDFESELISTCLQDFDLVLINLPRTIFAIGAVVDLIRIRRIYPDRQFLIPEVSECKAIGRLDRVVRQIIDDACHIYMLDRTIFSCTIDYLHIICTILVYLE